MTVITRDDVVQRVLSAHARGETISYGCGPSADRRARKAVGIPAHKSQVCAAIKEAIHDGLIVQEVTGEHFFVYSGCGARRYPIVELRPAPLALGFIAAYRPR